MPNELEYLCRVRELHISDEFIFPEGDGFRYRTFNQKVKSAAKAIGLDPAKYHTHSLRATAATNTYYACFDSRKVQALLGHTTVEMTEKYIHHIRDAEHLRSSREELIGKLSS
ncbi:MAG: tyrosine-type recombinase/integrase [Parasporobacterium sp.]|nr:tyrosine-type recombinase/integrase [Parasporobacterium sp.]